MVGVGPGLLGAAGCRGAGAGSGGWKKGLSEPPRPHSDSWAPAPPPHPTAQGQITVLEPVWLCWGVGQMPSSKDTRSGSETSARGLAQLLLAKGLGSGTSMPDPGSVSERGGGPRPSSGSTQAPAGTWGGPALGPGLCCQQHALVGVPTRSPPWVGNGHPVRDTVGRQSQSSNTFISISDADGA